MAGPGQDNPLLPWSMTKGLISQSARAGVSGILFCGGHLRLRPERRVGLTVVVCVARRVGCYPLPTPDLWEGPGAYVPGGVDVPAQAETATPAPIHPGSERHSLAMAASGAICAGMGRAHPHIRDTSFLGFVSQYAVEGTPPLSRHLLGVSTGVEQSRNVEVLDGPAVEEATRSCGPTVCLVERYYTEPQIRGGVGLVSVEASSTRDPFHRGVSLMSGSVGGYRQPLVVKPTRGWGQYV